MINSLIETLKDGQEGFKEAAEAVKDSDLKSLFNEFSEQRARFAAELQSEAISLGETEPEETSSTAGAIHRTWIDLKSAVTAETITRFWPNVSAAKIPRSRNMKRHCRPICPRPCVRLSRVNMPK